MSGSEIRCAACQTRVEKVLFDWGDTTVMVCDGCGLVFRRMAVELSESELFTRIRESGDVSLNPTSRYDARTGKSDARIAMWRDTLSALERRTDLGGKRLLDVGSAKGVFLDLARQNGWEVMGIEPLPSSAEYARQVFGLPVFEGTLEEAALPAGHFDIITMWDVIEHLKDPAGTLAEVFRVLKAGGLMIVLTPNHDSLVSALAQLAYRWSLRRLPLEYWLYPPVHLHFFTPTTLGGLLRRACFRVERIERAPLHAEKCVPAAAAVRAGASIVDAAGKLVGRPYRIVATACKPPDQETST